MISNTEFLSKDYVCPKCNWQGIGKNAESGILLEPHCIDVLCPRCYECLGVRAMPTIEERLASSIYYSDEEARRIQAGIPVKVAENTAFYNRLPDIDDDEIIITLHEEEKSPGSYYGDIVFSWKGKEFWREDRGFEYYTSYLYYAKFLKKKYGNRLIDFECEYTWALGGDSSRAFDEVRAFRKTLSNNSDVSDHEFDFITKSGEFSKKKATYWKAIEFAKERHAGQTRDEGTPYFEHILGTIEILRRHGHISDYIFTLAALHDILEDTETTKDELYELLRKVPSRNTIEEFMHVHDCDKVKAAEIYDFLNNYDARNMIAEIELLTHKDGVSFKEYIDRIFQDDSVKREGGLLGGANQAKYVKLADRIHNLSTLPLCGKPEKIQRKVRETEEYIMPWRDKHKECESLFARLEKRPEELLVLESEDFNKLHKIIGKKLQNLAKKMVSRLMPHNSFSISNSDGSLTASRYKHGDGYDWVKRDAFSCEINLQPSLKISYGWDHGEMRNRFGALCDGYENIDEIAPITGIETLKKIVELLDLAISTKEKQGRIIDSRIEF